MLSMSRPSRGVIYLLCHPVKDAGRSKLRQGRGIFLNVWHNKRGPAVSRKDLIARDILAGMGELEIPRDSLTDFLLPVARAAAGFIAAFLLAFIGDITARVFNLAIGYAWAQAVHQNIHFIGIGVGAGIGAFLGWMNLDRRWYLVLSSVVMVLAGGVAGAYLGRFSGPGVDPTYWWSRFATDTTVHLAAAALSTGIATVLGLIDLMYARCRLQPWVTPAPPAGANKN